jgi:DNA-binding NtrC family response regulator
MLKVAHTTKTRKTILFIGNDGDAHDSLRTFFRGPGWQLETAPTIRHGIELLRGADIPVVICEELLPDGDWKRVVAELHRLPRAVTLIVAARLADERLWAEVLNWGAFDLVFGGPFVAEEVMRVTESACRATARKSGEGARAKSAFAMGLAAPPRYVRQPFAGA